MGHARHGHDAGRRSPWRISTLPMARREDAGCDRVIHRYQYGHTACQHLRFAVIVSALFFWSRDVSGAPAMTALVKTSPLSKATWGSAVTGFTVLFTIGQNTIGPSADRMAGRHDKLSFMPGLTDPQSSILLAAGAVAVSARNRRTALWVRWRCARQPPIDFDFSLDGTRQIFDKRVRSAAAVERRRRVHRFRSRAPCPGLRTASASCAAVPLGNEVRRHVECGRASRRHVQQVPSTTKYKIVVSDARELLGEAAGSPSATQEEQQPSRSVDQRRLLPI